MGKLNLIAEPGSHALSITREFNAPRERVFEAYIDPEAVAKWWGQESAMTIVDQMEAKSGGVWRYVQREADGTEYAFKGVYHEVTAPERLVYTFEFEGIPGHVLLETITLTEQDGKTLLTDQSVFQSVEDRDGMIASGMEGGANESMDRLERYLSR